MRLIPFGQLVQDIVRLVVDGAIGFLQDIQQEASVFGCNINEDIDDFPGRFIGRFCVVKPAADAGVRLPGIGTGFVQQRTFHVQYAHPIHPFISAFLRIDRPVLAVEGYGLIIQVRHNLQRFPIAAVQHIFFFCAPLVTEGQRAVGIQQVRRILVDQFKHTPFPIIMKLLVGRIPGLKGPIIDMTGVFIIIVIKMPPGGIVAVVGNAFIGAIGIAALVDPPPAEGCPQMLRDAKGQVVFFRRRFPQPHDVLARPHPHAVHGVKG